MLDAQGAGDRVALGQLRVARVLHDFIQHEALPLTGVDARRFWAAFESLIDTLAPRNAQLLQRRDQLQRQIDAWHRAHPGPAFDRQDYRRLLEDIGYLVPGGEAFQIETRDVDPEIAATAGPQLVVPLDNARYALNAANARWGSLYDALYGTDAIAGSDGATRDAGYNAPRGAKVIAFARAFLDRHFPLTAGSHTQVAAYAVRVRIGADTCRWRHDRT